VYVALGRRRTGGGRALCEGLFRRLADRGFRTAVAGMALPNQASEGLHRAMGFEPVGVYRRIGWKHGAWRDVAWAQLALASGRTRRPSRGEEAGRRAGSQPRVCRRGAARGSIRCCSDLVVIRSHLDATTDATTRSRHAAVEAAGPSANDRRLVALALGITVGRVVTTVTETIRLL
jgi:hypothetical protein